MKAPSQSQATAPNRLADDGSSFVTGPISRAMLDELRRYVVTEPKPFVVDIAASRGMYLATIEGQRLFDWAGFFGSKLIGHNHPALDDPQFLLRLARAAKNKTPNPDFLTPECLEYYRLLHRLAPTCMKGHPIEVYTVNSGAEAVENMMKYLIKLHDAQHAPDRRRGSPRRFIYFDNAFHGRTVFALGVTKLAHDPIITEDFHDFVPGNLRVPFPAFDASRSPQENQRQIDRTLRIVESCLSRYAEEIVAIIVEPIQGAGGHRVAHPSFFQRLSTLAHRYSTYLAFDEVQTAGGQTGTVFAIDQFNLPHPPQAVATGKKFGNGVVYMLTSLGNLNVLDSTWGGCLADMVRFVREFEVVETERLIEQVPPKAQRLTHGLQHLVDRFTPLISNVRGMGLYQGFSCRDAATAAALRHEALHKESLLLLGAGPGEIRLRPALDVTEDEIDRFLAILERCLKRLARQIH